MKLKLYKGNRINAGVTSPFTLYDEQTASFARMRITISLMQTVYQPVGLPIAEARQAGKELAGSKVIAFY